MRPGTGTDRPAVITATGDTCPKMLAHPCKL